MTENMKKFLEAVSGNEELAKKIGNMSKEEILAAARELGAELTDADFAAPQGELGDDELDAVAGGKTCVCVAGGGGEKSKNDDLCVCIYAGFGMTTDNKNRCTCALGGAGYNN